MIVFFGYINNIMPLPIPQFIIDNVENSDVYRGIRYSSNLPEKERDALTRRINWYTRAKSKLYPNGLNSVSSFPDYLEDENFNDFDEFEDDIEDDLEEDFDDDEETEENWDPVPDFSIDFD